MILAAPTIVNHTNKFKQNNLDDLTPQGVLIYHLNNNQMIAKTSASARSKTPERTSSVLSEKRCKTNIFVNEKINQLINIRYLDTPMKTVNKVLFVPQARYISAVPHNQIPNNSKSALFDRTYRASNDTFRQILRHNTSNSSKKRAFSLKQPLSQSKETVNHVSASKNNSFSFKSVRTKMLQEYDIAQTVRKQIEKKFQRTKMIFKEEAKMKKIQKMQQIYEKKLKITRKLNIDKQGNVIKLKSNDYQPWQKNRLKSYEQSFCETEEKQG